MGYDTLTLNEIASLQFMWNYESEKFFK